ncbi:MAG TPA: alpha/beta fold hydrolase, partial [Flavobacteriales bacterium]|nr:alpha/beta fold hydrolase [Flavobacteriales bacterium]
MVLHSKILGQGMPLIILHGLLGMGDNWITLARQYAQNGFQVHLVDLRNHGKSFHDDQMTYDDMVADILEYMSYHQIDKAHVIGHSMGGKVAMNLAISAPDHIDKLIIVDIAPKLYPPHHYFIFEAIHQLNLTKLNTRKEAEEILLKQIESKPIVQFILKNLGRDKKGHFKWKANMPVLENALQDLGEALPPLSVFNKPVLFIKGT